MISTTPLATQWTQQDKERVDLLLAELDAMLVRPDGRMSMTGALMQESLSEACNPLLNPVDSTHLDSKSRRPHPKG